MLPSTNPKASAPRTSTFSVLISPAHPYRYRRFACPLAGTDARLAEKRGSVTPSFQGTSTPYLLPVRNDTLGFKAVAQLVQVHRLVLQRPPQPFDEHVVQAPSAAIHRALRPGRQNPLGERHGGELRSLVGVEDLRRSVAKGRSSASMHMRLSIVFDSRHESTKRLAQSITATKYKYPCETGYRSGPRTTRGPDARPSPRAAGTDRPGAAGGQRSYAACSTAPQAPSPASAGVPGRLAHRILILP